jgi:hypothetical protein
MLINPYRTQSLPVPCFVSAEVGAAAVAAAAKLIATVTPSVVTPAAAVTVTPSVVAGASARPVAAAAAAVKEGGNPANITTISVDRQNWVPKSPL